MRFGGLGGKTMNKDNFEFVKEFSCACGKTHNTQVDDVIIEKGAIKRVPEVIARYPKRNFFTICKAPLQACF